MSRNLKIYLAFSVVWSLMFFAVLDWATADTHSRWWACALGGLAYGVGFAVLGYVLGRPDDQREVRYSLNYAYAAVSNITSAVIGTAWILLFKPEAYWWLFVYVPIVVFFIVYGLAVQRRTVKGFSDQELFR